MKIVNNYMTTVLNVLSAETLTLAKISKEVDEFTEEGNIQIKNFSIDKKINWKVL